MRHIFRKRWWVYVYDPKTKTFLEVGKVMARHQPDALLNAFKKWPQYCDQSQVQAGFRVTRDRL